MGTIVSIHRPFRQGGSWSRDHVDKVLREVAEARFPGLLTVEFEQGWTLTFAESDLEWSLFLRGAALAGKMPMRFGTSFEWVYWEVLNAVACRLQGRLAADSADEAWDPRPAETFRQFWQRRWAHLPEGTRAASSCFLLVLLRAEVKAAPPCLRAHMKSRLVPQEFA